VGEEKGRREPNSQRGVRDDLAVLLGTALLGYTALYAVPRTSVLYPILLTGPSIKHLRAGDPVCSHVLFPVYLGVWIWAALWLQ
jgi:hypothetical protein